MLGQSFYKACCWPQPKLYPAILNLGTKRYMISGIGASKKVTPLEASLRYAIGIEEIDKVVVGVDTPTQLDELLSASTGILPEIPSELQTFEPGLLDPRLWH